MLINTEQGLTPTDRQAIAHILLWGKQTIAFAFSVRDDDTRRQLDKPDVAAYADAVAEQLNDELWQAALAECGEGAKLSAVVMLFVHKVFDFSYDHMNP